MRPPSLSSLGTWLWQRLGLLLVTLAALAVRLGWNLRVHPPLDFVYSDMAGYLDRADAMIDKPTAWSGWFTLFPYGTHFFLFALKSAFGRDNGEAIGVAYAVVGALAVAYTYATAGRFLPRPWARRLVGLVLVLYYPWIALGGYTLSEMPFALGVAASSFYALRLADRGRRGDAWRLGLALGLGAALRPQILIAAGLLPVHFFLRRRVWRHFTPGLAARAAAPLVIILAFSAYRLHAHGSGWGLISTNGPLNFVFGRCHNTTLEAVAGRTRGFFSPPPLGSLLEHQREHRRSLFRLDPVIGEKLTFNGHMWDAEPNDRLARACVAKTGYLKQARFSLTHVVLLWGYNVIWPDEALGEPWYHRMEIAGAAHNVAVLPGAALALLLAFRPRRGRALLLAVQVWSVVLTAMIYFGDTRYRAPYDGLLIVLAMGAYLDVLRLPRRAWDRVYEGVFRPDASARAIASSPAGSSPASAASAAASASSRRR